MIDQSINTTSSLRRQLPNELIEMIVEHIKMNGQLRTLAAIARASCNMYNIVIPRLYETVTVTTKNERHVAYGHTPCYEDGNNEGKPINREPNRKDIATTFTRKLVLDSVPSRILPGNYIAATTVVVKAEPLIRSDCDGLAIFLGAITQVNMSSTPLHVLFDGHRYICGEDGRKYRSGDTFTQCLEYLICTPITATLEYLGFDPEYHEDLLDIAYLMRAVLHIRPRLDDYTGNLTILSLRLLHTAKYFMSSGGRVYLCGVPDFVLTSAELLAAGDDANDIARIKVYQHMSSMSNVYSRTWDHFKSHVQFVNPGFRPTLEDVVVATEMGQKVTTLQSLESWLTRRILLYRLARVHHKGLFWGEEWL